MKEELLSIGFGGKDAEIYLALMKLGKANIAKIMRKTPIERRTIYDVLERLIQKGWASYFEENGKRYYVPAKPEMILEDLDQKKGDFAKIVSKLNSLKENSTEARVEIYKGVKGLKSIFLDISNSREMHYSFGNITPFMYEPYEKIVNRFLDSLKSKKVGERVIYAKGDPINKISGGQYKAIKRELIPPTPTIVYGDVTVQFIFTDPTTIIKITSKDIAKTNKQYFDYFWRMK